MLILDPGGLFSTTSKHEIEVTSTDGYLNGGTKHKYTINRPECHSNWHTLYKALIGQHVYVEDEEGNEYDGVVTDESIFKKNEIDLVIMTTSHDTRGSYDILL